MGEPEVENSSALERTLYKSAILISYFRCAVWASNLLLLRVLGSALKTVSRNTIISLASIGGAYNRA
jgi:hypothetical protein